MLRSNQLSYITNERDYSGLSGAYFSLLFRPNQRLVKVGLRLFMKASMPSF